MINDLSYVVDNQYTYSKIQALIWAGGDVNKIRFNAMESTFDFCDWARPTESWEKLLKIRCQQLREKYDYLCLWFSGGWDSTTVLDAFARNKIKLDEVAIYQREFIDDIEPVSAATYAEHIKKNYLPELTINFVRIDHKHHDSVYKKYNHDWIITPGCNLMFPKLHRWFFYNELDSVQQSKITSKGRRGNIEAHDKPRVMLNQNRWYSFIPDVSVINYMGTDVEMFYISPDLPELHVAQTHMSIDYMEQQMALLCRDTDERFSHEVQSHSKEFFQSWNLSIGRSCVDNISAKHGLLKSTTGQNPISIESSQLLNYSMSTKSKSYEIYQQGLSDILEITGYDIKQGVALPTILSKQYHVRDYKNMLSGHHNPPK